MIFIKNYVDNLTGADFSLSMETSSNEVSVKLSIGDNKDNSVTIIKSSDMNVVPSIKNSLNYVANITNNMTETDDTFTTQILDNKATEIAFFKKDKKIVLLNSGDLPITVGECGDVEPEKHYPRDMIVMVCPKIFEGKNANFYLVVDPRNVGYPVFIKDLSNYRIIVMSTKYPIWDKLKFPVYAYIKANVNGTDTPVSAFKLGSQKVSKTFFKNVIEDIDIQIAKDYLDESFKTLRAKSNSNNKPYNNNRGNKPNFNKSDDNRGSYGNRDRSNNRNNNRNNNRTGVPGKYGKKPFNKGNR